MPPVPDPVDDNKGSSDLTGNVGPGVIEFGSDTESDSGSSDVDDTTAGYVPLSQGPDESDDESSSTNDDMEREDNSQASAIKRDMPADQVDQIKSVMANIKLSNIPEWADKIPETQWMGQLFTNIQRKKEVTTPNINKQSVCPNKLGSISGSTTNSEATQPGVASNFADFEANFPS